MSSRPRRLVLPGFPLPTLLSLLVLASWAVPAEAVRVCSVDVTGESDSAGEVTVLTEVADVGTPVQPAFPPISELEQQIADDTPATAAAQQIATAIANAGMHGVVGATASGDDIVVTLQDNASMAIWESEKILGQSYSLPACDTAVDGDELKVRVDLSVRRIVVPNGDRTWRPVRWTVENISGAALPAGFQVRWEAFGDLALRRDVDSGVALAGLAPGASLSFIVEARIEPQNPPLQRGRAWARPNMDPPLDDPRLLPLEIVEGPSECVTTGRQPAATLLYPYFEVDLDDAAGTTTLLSVTNTADRCTLTRLMLWTDQGVPTLTSYVYLSPNDVQTLNLRDVLNGKLPDTSDTLVNPECPVLDRPLCEPEQLDTELIQLELAGAAPIHVGASDAESGLCAGVDRGDNVARGYVTLDVVDGCAYPPTARSWQRPEWDAPEGFFRATGTSFDNVLWGNWHLVKPSQAFAQGDTAVHVPADPDRLDPGEYTFYGRYVGFDASDGRLPLSRRFRSRFLSGGPFDGGTTLLVWRDNRSAVTTPRPCSGTPPWAPLGEAGVIGYDEDENEFLLGTTDVDPLAGDRLVATPGLGLVCPVADSAVSYACALDLPVPFGFLDLDLAHGDGTPAQAWVTSVMSASGLYSVGIPAVPQDDLCDWTIVPTGSPPVQ